MQVRYYSCLTVCSGCNARCACFCNGIHTRCTVPAAPAVLQMYGSGSSAAQVEQAFAGGDPGADAAAAPGSPPSPYIVRAALLPASGWQGLPAQDGSMHLCLHECMQRWLLS